MTVTNNLRSATAPRSLQERVLSDGFAIVPNALPEREVADLLAVLEQSELPRSRAGMRHAMRNENVAAVACDSRLAALAQEILGNSAIPFRATLFDKSPTSNWLVVWHQDTALPLRERREVPGWGPWSIKDGVNYAHAPASALEQVLALRLHLDDSVAENGPLRVLPGTHTLGVLSDDALHELSRQIAAVDCLMPKGGILAMRPLVVHASSKSQSSAPRRVLHVEYAVSSAITNGLELAIA
ncbi:MAG TPA: phytanoyl-CoA dioxygenase family protein [Candidatus Acidoferrum sp.]|jgi:ectoine hydroxylase-related dioxygenase (phytanoyl-CoA dioxygenase family)|nr:phytanoyl-CoA dioxygenase family protein [Candidatus Acidoferrum sp.]